MDSQIIKGKKEMGPKETKSYPERENGNEFHNQNSWFDCKDNFSSRLALKQHNNIHLGTKMFHYIVLLKIVKWHFVLAAHRT